MRRRSLKFLATTKQLWQDPKLQHRLIKKPAIRYDSEPAPTMSHPYNLSPERLSYYSPIWYSILEEVSSSKFWIHLFWHDPGPLLPHIFTSYLLKIYFHVIFISPSNRFSPPKFWKYFFPTPSELRVLSLMGCSSYPVLFRISWFIT
jgi:hypothetical protein